jgi:hypothetical protein
LDDKPMGGSAGDRIGSKSISIGERREGGEGRGGGGSQPSMAGR